MAKQNVRVFAGRCGAVSAFLAGLGMVSCQALDPVNKYQNGARGPESATPVEPDLDLRPVVRRPEPVPEKPESSPGVEAAANATVLKAQGLDDQALVAFERAIAENPELTIAYLGAGDIYREKGDYKTAQKRYEAASEVEPGNFDAQFHNGLMLQLLNRVSEAVRAYLRALQIRPDDFQANQNLATSYFQLGEARQALPYAERAVQLSGKDGPARVNLGSIYASLDRHAEAVTEFQQAAELIELTPELLMNLATSLGKIERFQEMANTIDQIIKIRPSAAAHERLGFATFRLGRYDESLAQFRKALALDQNYYPALNGVGICLLNDWIKGGTNDEPTKRDGMRALLRSLHIEPNQPHILAVVTKYQ